MSESTRVVNTKAQGKQFAERGAVECDFRE